MTAPRLGRQPLLGLLLLWLAIIGVSRGDNPVGGGDTKHEKTNYERQAISITYEDEGLPVFGTLNGTVTELETLSPSIALNKTEASLGCASGFMNVKLKFKQPFYGIVYADYDRNSACKIGGNGKLEETIKLPLKGCGTLQVSHSL